MGISIRGYARRRGVSDAAVRKAIAAGRIPQEADGTIDPARADAAWAANTGVPRADGRGQARGARPAPAAAAESVRQTLREEGLPAGGALTFAAARTAHEAAKAHLARLRLQERRGQVVDRARAAALVFRLAREERDAWLNWPARIAAVMAADLGVEPHGVQKALDTHVRAHLQELATIEPQFR